GKFAPGRIAIWRKWLVEHENPVVLDEVVWRRMADAFLPDLQYEFGQDRARIDYYLQQLEVVKQDSMRKITQVAVTATKPDAASPVRIQRVTSANDAVVRTTDIVVRSAAARSATTSITFTGPIFEATAN